MEKNLAASCDDILNSLLKGRRTIHDFDVTPVAEDIIENALESLRWAPNHYLSEPWRVYLVGVEGRRKIATLNAKVVEKKMGPKAAAIKLERWSKIPGWLVINSVVEGDEIKQREDYAACCCGIQNLMLSFWAANVGVKWTTGAVTRLPEFSEIIGFDRSKETVVGLFWFGLAKVIPSQRRKPLSNFLTRIP